MLDGDVCGAVIDGHVHLYDCFDTQSFLTAAFDNLSLAAAQIGHARGYASILLLAESPQERAFERLLDLAALQGRNSPSDSGLRWRVDTLSTDKAAILATDDEGNTLTVIAGKQVTTREGLEVLALGTEQSVESAYPLVETISVVNSMDAIAVIPWGVGKWLGRRGKLLRRFLESANGRDVFLGDISGRPWLWPRSSLFALAHSRGIRVLPGTDPLPFESEVTRIGSCAFYVDHSLSMSNPTSALKSALRESQVSIREYLRPESTSRFLRNQLHLRLQHAAIQ